jgi:hypothetical protein
MINKKKLRRVLYIYIAVIFILVFSSRTIYNFTLPTVSVVMPQSAALYKELKVSGTMAFADTTDIFASASGRIDEMFLVKGEPVNENGVIALLHIPDAEAKERDHALNIARLENQMAVLQLRKSTVQDKIRETYTTPEGLHGYIYAVEDAERLLAYQQLLYMEAFDSLYAGFDGYTYEQAVLNTGNELKKAITDAEEAETNFLLAEEGDFSFDDYSYQQTIESAYISLKRMQEALAEAETTLNEAKQANDSNFIGTGYQNAVNMAKTSHERSREDYNEVLRQFDLAVRRYYDALLSGADETVLSAAQSEMDNKQASVRAAQRMVDDAETAWEKAVRDMAAAERAHQVNQRENRLYAITEAERLVKQSLNNANDAQRVYDRAVEGFARARAAYVRVLENKLNLSRQAAEEASQRYEKALLAFEKAYENETHVLSSRLTEAERSVTEAMTALIRAEAWLIQAQETAASQSEYIRKSLINDLAFIELDIEKMQTELHAALHNAPSGDSAAILSNRAGIAVSVEKSPNQYVALGEKIATVGLANNAFISEISVAETDGRFIEVGDTANITGRGIVPAIKATVTAITLTGGVMNITVSCETDRLKGGELVTITFNKQTPAYDMVVPSEAIFTEGFNHYIWVVRSKMGALGMEYHTAKVKVFITDFDDYNTAISRGIFFFEPVVVGYSGDLSVNGRVRRME